MSCCKTTYTSSATATSSTIANNSETVTATSSATASSTLSLTDAYDNALSIANSVAKSTAQTDANILNQSFLKTIALGNNYTVPDNSNYNYIKGDSTSINIPIFFPLTTSTNTIYASAVDSKGNFYVGGVFTRISNINGLKSSDNLTTVFNNIAMWNGTTWSTLANGIIGTVYAITIDSSDNVYVGGSFAEIPDYASDTSIVAYNIAKWTPSTSTWSVLGTSSANGTNSTVYTIAIDSNNVFVGGNFTLVNYTGPVPNTNTGTSANYIARWSGSAWNAFGTNASNGTNGEVKSIAISSTNTLYVGGTFTTISFNGTNTTANRIASFTNGAWSVLGTSISQNGTNNSVNAIIIDKNNNVYVGGGFTFVNYNGTTGTVANYIAMWTPSTSIWSTLGTGTTSTGNGTNNIVNALATDPLDNVFVGGTFTKVYKSSTSFVYANNIARWNISWNSVGGPNGTNSNGLPQNTNIITQYRNNIYANGYRLYSNYINISYNDNIVYRLYLNGQSVNIYASNNNGNKLCTVVNPTQLTQNYF